MNAITDFPRTEKFVLMLETFFLGACSPHEQNRLSLGQIFIVRLFKTVLPEMEHLKEQVADAYMIPKITLHRHGID